MSHPEQGAVTLLETKTDFEAEAIAAALRARGVEAYSADLASARMLANVIVKSKVIVPAHAEGLARQVLEEIKVDMTHIDWDAMDIGPEEDVPRMHAARRGRRVIVTMCVFLVPLGLGVLSIGAQRGDVMIQAIGGAVTLCSLAIAMAMTLFAGRGAGVE